MSRRALSSRVGTGSEQRFQRLMNGLRLASIQGFLVMLERLTFVQCQQEVIVGLQPLGELGVPLQRAGGYW